MPIYRQQPPLVVDTALEIIKDDSVAPSPATILPPQLPPSTPTPNVRPEDVARIMNDTLQRVIAAQSQRDLSRFNSSAAQNGSAIVDDNDVEDLDFDRRYTMAAERFMRRPPATSWTKTAQPVPIRTGHSDQTDAFSSGTFDIPQRSQYTSTKLRAFSDVSQLLSRPTFSPLAASFPDVVDERTEEEEDLDLLPLHDQRGRSPSSDYTYRRDHSRTPSSGVASDSFRVCDPCADVTRIRTTTRGNKYIYPGATFTGTQKSGRNNYDVTVTVVDVDFASSFLCGYLKINGLTEDWPELTTYFDAEIIGGSRYGFLTSDKEYGASEAEDMTHWGRFPAFRSIKPELKRPGLTISDRELARRGVVFMRWKERFLVPDWKVRDINGASFAGFYYVCVEFGPNAHHSSTTSTVPTPAMTPARRFSSTYPTTSSSSPAWNNSDLDAAFPSLHSSVQAARPCIGKPQSDYPRKSNPGATMTGFYYHCESEPYQQLSLNYVPKRAKPTFELA